ncbi:MAG: 3-deoxy-7-phosphoheptulonate synthase, partial [Thiotrichales bacterium]|nr:3-deoxy-7-phosphoheptulonate synthase [Thiotrichales bacterium]
NATDGTTRVAVDAIMAASRPHHFLSLRKEGMSAIFTTKGNGDCHVILRGGKQTNYDAESIEQVINSLKDAKLTPRLMVDFSHANSMKQHKKQFDAGRDVCQQIASGSDAIFGIMIESHLVEGRQDVKDIDKLVYGQSITDACLGWDDSEQLIAELSDAVAKRLQG